MPSLHRESTDSLINSQGYTPLHEAVAKEVPLNVMEALVLHKNLNPNVANFEGLTPLQMAVDSQQMDKATVLFNSKKCSHEDTMKVTEKSSLFFSAAYSDNLELLTALLRAGVDINTSNSKGETALHIACKEGNTKATKLLLQNEANLLAVDRIGNAPIHVACAYMRFECLDLLLGYHVCNPNQRNVVGETPLHMLCSNGKTCDMRMLHTLLSTPGINPECANHLGQTPAELADSNYSVIKMISKCLEHRNTQLETYLKIFVVGNSGGGKSTLIKAVTTERSKSFKNSFKAKHVKPSEVPPHTAGIVPLPFNSKHFGHAVLYDFAGQHEYYSSHAAVMENLVLPSPPLLLTEVNGSIFAPDNFKEHCSGFAMSTGVVPLSKIRETFGEPNNQVITGYLTHLEFCFRIKDKHTLEMITKDTTLQLTTHSSEHAEEYYFFPALIWKENPSDVCQPQETIKYECGWFYRCSEPTEQLTTRFLHVLILRLAFSCDPPDEPTERESVVLLRSCSVWKHGIAWWTNDGIETIVEVGLQCRWVAVMLRCPDTHKVQCAELRTKVISTVLKTKQDFCPAIGMKEFLIAPSSLQYPFEGRELTLYSMREISQIAIAGKEFPKNTEENSTIHISKLLPFEPFFNVGEDLIGNLFSPDQSREELLWKSLHQIAKKCNKKLHEFEQALQPDPSAFQEECVKPNCTDVDRFARLLLIVQRRGCKTWRDFEQEFSRFSIFCGRNPMVS